jgi:FkbM family methyltransferase
LITSWVRRGLRPVRKVWKKTKLACGMPGLYRNWPLAMLSLIIRERRPFVVRLRRGVDLCLHAHSLDTYIVNEVWIDRVYTPSAGFAIRDGWVVVDLGGHKGIFSAFAATVAKDVKVYAFEPSPENFVLLSHNIQLNRLSNVKAFNIAVGGQSGESVLHIFPDNGQNSLLQRSNPQLRPISDVTVETWSLSRVLETVASPVNLLKMDIEGMEYEVLFSCPAEHLQKVERIALEYHESVVRTGHSVPELVEFLNRRGFSTHLQPRREILLAERASEKTTSNLVNLNREDPA